jgi:hypothetical protein
VLGFLDADAAWGSQHDRTHRAKTLLQRVVSMTVREAAVVDREQAMLDGTAA